MWSMRKNVATLTRGLPVVAFAGYSFFQPLAPYQTERFELTAGPAAAHGYPMEIEQGRFLTADGKSIPFGPEFLQGAWGHSHSVVVHGDGTAPAPDSLEMRWFSYTEDKFYEGHWALPQRRIYDLLKQRFWVRSWHRYERYTELTVCLLPTGVAVVWLTGANQVLIGRYQAQAINFDFKRFNPAAKRPLLIKQEQAKLPPSVQAEIRGGQLSSQPWDDYLLTYPWKLELSQPLTLYDSGVAYFNAERAYYSTSLTTPTQLPALLAALPKPVPRYLRVTGTLPDGRRRQLRVRDFDEAQTLAAFRTLHAAHPGAPLTLRLETNADLTQGHLLLKNAYQAMPLSCSSLELNTPRPDE
jgi:hypothetical protein